MGWTEKELVAYDSLQTELERAQTLKLERSYNYEGIELHFKNTIDQLKLEVETLRMQLAACGVAAMCNTQETMDKQRIDRDNPYWSASYGDVCNAVDREIALRLMAESYRTKLVKVREAWDWLETQFSFDNNMAELVAKRDRIDKCQLIEEARQALEGSKE